MMFWTDYGHC